MCSLRQQDPTNVRPTTPAAGLSFGRLARFVSGPPVYSKRTYPLVLFSRSLQNHGALILTGFDIAWIQQQPTLVATSRRSSSGAAEPSCCERRRHRCCGRGQALLFDLLALVLAILGIGTPESTATWDRSTHASPPCQSIDSQTLVGQTRNPRRRRFRERRATGLDTHRASPFIHESVVTPKQLFDRAIHPPTPTHNNQALQRTQQHRINVGGRGAAGDERHRGREPGGQEGAQGASAGVNPAGRGIFVGLHMCMYIGPRVGRLTD